MTGRAKKRVALLVGILVVLGLAGAGALALRRAQVGRMQADALAKGMAAHGAGDHDAALKHLSTYVGRNKKDADALLALAQSRRQVPMENSRHLVRAADFARQATITAADPAPALEMLLDLYAELRYWPERLETADRLIAADPAHRRAMLAKTESLFALGRPAEALGAAKAMAASMPDDAEAHTQVLRLLELNQRPKSELIDYADALGARDPGRVEFVLLQVQANAVAGNIDDAKGDARRAAEMPIPSAAVLSNLLKLLDLLGLDEEAAGVLTREQEHPERGADAAVVSAERAWKLGRIDQARAALAGLAASPATASDLALGWAAVVGASDAAADPALAELRTRRTDEAQAWVALLDARLAILKNDLPVARERLIRSSEHPSTNSLAHYMLGQLERQLGEPERAIEHLRIVTDREPKWTGPRLVLADILLKKGLFREAYQEAQNAYVAHPDAGAVLMLARASTELVESGGADQAEINRATVVAEEIYEQAPESGEAAALLARAYMAADRLADAERLIDTIIKDGPVPPAESILSLASACRRNGVEGVEQLLALAGEEHADDPSVLFARAVRAAEGGRADEGKTILRDAVNARQGDERVGYEAQLAAFLDRIRDPEAVDILARLAEEHPAQQAFQINLLESAMPWSRNDVVQKAINRLKAITGADRTAWKLYEARRLLTFERDRPQTGAEVVILLTEVLRANPRDSLALALTAEASLLQGAPLDAIGYLSQAVDVAASPTDLYPGLIALHQQHGQAEAAAQRLAEFMRISDLSPVLRRRRAELLLAQGMRQEGAAELEALAQSGDQADLLAFAKFQAESGQTEDAARLFESILGAGRVEPDAAGAAAEFYATRGDVDHGLQILERSLTDAPAANRKLLIATFLERHGRAAEAETLFAQQAESEDRPEIWAELARFHAARRQIDKAQAAVDRGLARKPDDPRLQMLAVALRLMRDTSVPPEEAAAIGAILDEYVEVGVLRQFLEHVEGHRKDPSEAGWRTLAERMTKMTEANPTFYPPWHLLTVAYSRLGQPDQAARTAQAAAMKMPASARAAGLASNALANARQPEEALRLARQWRDLSPGDTFPADLRIARLQTHLGREAEALVKVEQWKDRILAGADAEPEPLELYATLLARLGRQDEADAMIGARADADRGWAIRYLNVGRALIDRPEAARTWIDRAERRLLDAPDARFHAGMAWFDLAASTGQPEDFARVIAALSELPSDPAQRVPALACLAASHEQRGELSEAEATYRALLKEQPDHPAALNNLAYLLLKQSASSEEAVTLAEQAVKSATARKMPDSQLVHFLDTLATALARIGRDEEAEGVFRRALAIDPAKPLLLIGLAESLVNLDRLDEARVTLRRVDEEIGSAPPPREAADRLVSLRQRLGARPLPAAGGGGG